MSKIKPGDLKHRPLIEQSVRTPDGQGGHSVSWDELGYVWAKAHEMSPRERFYRGENQHTQGMTFTIRQKQAFAIPGTQQSDTLRITHRGQYFRVIGISQNKYDSDFFDVACELWGATTS